MEWKRVKREHVPGHAGFRRGPVYSVRPNSQQDYDQSVIERHYRQLLFKRIRRVSRVAIAATRTNTTAKSRRQALRIRQLQQQLKLVAVNRYRIAAACLVAVFGLSSILPTFLQANDARPIELSQSVLALIGESRDDSKQYLNYDSTKRTYSFAAQSQEATGNYQHTGRNADAYTTTLPQNAEDGVTVTENKTKIAVTLKPQFFTATARKSSGDHLVYRSGRAQLIYTHKYNGLKEDIIIPSFEGPSLEYKFKLVLPSGVEARLDEHGNIDIYSGDSTLYGNISYGSDEDRAKVEKARDSAEKTNLVMTIPYPIIKDNTGTEFTDRASFSLSKKTSYTTKKDFRGLTTEKGGDEAPERQVTTMNEYVLGLKAHSLNDLSYPISIDPTLQVTSSADFNKLNLEGGTSIDTTNNLIKRQSLTGGMLNSWNTDDTALQYGQFGNQFFIYNGYAYNTPTNGTSNVYYAPVNSNTGDVGSFTNSGVAAALSARGGSVIYNGYYYSSGDGSVPGGGTNVSYAKINADGSIAAAVSTSSFSSARKSHRLVAYKGYLYVVAGMYETGCPLACANNYRNDIQYAKINADGSLGAWASAGGNLNTARGGHAAVIYNGYVYVTGGQNAGTSAEYAKMNADGTTGTWTTSANLPASRNAHTMFEVGGYMYIAGHAYGSETYFASINADGSLGTWQTTTSLPASRGGAASVVYNGRIYVAGGHNGSADQTTVYITAAQPAGYSTNWTEDTSSVLPDDEDVSGTQTVRIRHQSLAYNGRLYVAGGCYQLTNNCDETFSNEVDVATINTDGTLGTWSDVGVDLPYGLSNFAMEAYNGYMYIYGGWGTCGLLGAAQACNQTYRSVIASNGTLGSWTSDDAMVNQRERHAHAVYNGYLYASGGLNEGGNTESTTEYALINSDGTIGAWATTSHPSSQTFFEGTIEPQSGYMYAVGGCRGSPVGCSVISNQIIRAKINTNGTLSAWANATGGTHTTGIHLHDSYFYNGYLYISGGETSDGSTETASVQYAPLNGDGSFGAWATTTALDTAMARHQAVVYNGQVFTTGGCTNVNGGTCFSGALRDKVFYATINNGGPGINSSLTTDAGGNFSIARTSYPSAIAYKGYLYVAGGQDTATNYTASVQYAPINTDGSIGTWAATSSLITPTIRHASVVYNDYIYVIGGANDANNNKLVQYAHINTDGTLDAWVQDTGSVMAEGRSEFGAAIYNGYLYVVGRRADTTGLVEYAPLNSDGSVGTWASTSTLNTPRGRHAVVQANGYLYAIAGCTDNNSVCAVAATLGSVEVAKINADGTLGAWTYTTGIAPRWATQATIYNGNLYVVSGYANLSEIYLAPVLGGGGIGDWQKSSNSLPSGRFTPGVTAYQGYMYVAGGGTDGASANGTDTTYYAPLQSIPRIAQVSKLYDFDVGVRPTKLITRGTKRTGSTTSVSYTSANYAAGSVTLDNAQSITDASYTGANPQTLSLGTNRTLPRYFFLRYTIDDSLSAVFPDSGNESTITDWDLYYTSNPGSRLRGGRTFTNQQDRGLDAAPQ